MSASQLHCPLCKATFDEAGLGRCPNDGAELRSAQPDEHSLIGAVLQERYRVERFLGQGGMAQVYEGEHLASGRKVAIKVVQPRLVSDQVMLERFRHEARLVALIAHPNVVAIEDFGSLPDGSLFMVMELLRGRSLHAILGEGMLDPALALDVAIQVCEAVQAVHERNIVHRDLKPANVHLQRIEGVQTAPRVEVKVLDFGISKLVGEDATSDLTRTGTLFGTPEYMSPEQALGRPADFRSDIYAVGVLLYRMLIGRVPFTADSFLAVLAKHLSDAPEWPGVVATARNLPPETEEVVMKALKKSPELRYKSAAHFAESLLELRNKLTRTNTQVTGLGETTDVIEAVTSLRSAAFRTCSLPTATGGDREVVEVAPDVYWVGRRQGAVLECNVYLRVYRRGSTRVSVLIDPGPPRDLEVIAGKVASVVESIANIDILFLNHQDPDVSSNAGLIQQANPRVHVLCSEDTWRLVHFYGLKPQSYSATEHFRDQTMHVSTGHDVVFVPTPFCHFRGAVAYYDVATRVLFTGDLFGGLSRSNRLLSTGDEWDDIDVFHQLYMPTNVALRRAVERIRRLDPKPTLLAPQHGALIPEKQIDDLLARIERLPVGMDLETTGAEASRYLAAANAIIVGLVALCGKAVVESHLRRFSADGTFPNIFVFASDGTLREMKIEPQAAMKALLRDLCVVVPENRCGDLQQLLDDAQRAHRVRLPEVGDAAGPKRSL